MKNATEQALNCLVRQQFERNEDILLEAAMRGCEEQDSYQETYAKMLLNSMEISAEVSVRIMVEILIMLGMVGEKDERQIMKKMLSVVRGAGKDVKNG